MACEMTGVGVTPSSRWTATSAPLAASTSRAVRWAGAETAWVSLPMKSGPSIRWARRGARAAGRGRGGGGARGGGGVGRSPPVPGAGAGRRPAARPAERGVASLLRREVGRFDALLVAAALERARLERADDVHVRL